MTFDQGNEILVSYELIISGYYSRLERPCPPLRSYPRPVLRTDTSVQTKRKAIKHQCPGAPVEQTPGAGRG